MIFNVLIKMKSQIYATPAVKGLIDKRRVVVWLFKEDTDNNIVVKRDGFVVEQDGECNFKR